MRSPPTAERQRGPPSPHQAQPALAPAREQAPVEEEPAQTHRRRSPPVHFAENVAIRTSSHPTAARRSHPDDESRLGADAAYGASSASKSCNALIRASTYLASWSQSSVVGSA